MRKITRENSDLNWLFPDVNDDGITSKDIFNHYESRAYELYDKAYPNKDEHFTKDDIIDSFMKGASVAYSDVINENYRLKDRLIFTKKKLKEAIETYETLLKILKS